MALTQAKGHLRSDLSINCQGRGRGNQRLGSHRWETKKPALGRSGHSPGPWIPEDWMLRCLPSGIGVYPRSLTCRKTGAQDMCGSGGHLGSWCHGPACSLSLPHHLLHVSGGPGLGEGLMRLGGEGTQGIPHTQGTELKKPD